MKSEGYVPPYTITDNIINLIAEISELVGSISVSSNMNSNPNGWFKKTLIDTGRLENLP